MEVIMAVLLAAMSLIVFLNVVLRYGFHSGINGSEDIARLAFIWLCFIGVVPMMILNGHLGVDVLLQRLPPRVRRPVGLAGRLLMGWVLGLLAYGTWQQMMLNTDTPAMGAIAYPLAWNYAAGLFAAVGCLLCVLRDIIELLGNNLRCLVSSGTEEPIDAPAPGGFASPESAGIDRGNRA